MNRRRKVHVTDHELVEQVERILRQAAQHLENLIGYPIRVGKFRAANAIHVPTHHSLEVSYQASALWGLLRWRRWVEICKVGGNIFVGAGIMGPLLVSIDRRWLDSDRYSLFLDDLYNDLEKATGLNVEFRNY